MANSRKQKNKKIKNYRAINPRNFDFFVNQLKRESDDEYPPLCLSLSFVQFSQDVHAIQMDHRLGVRSGYDLENLDGILHKQPTINFTRRKQDK